MSLCFFSGKRVLITGHTGFKGAWLSKVLLLAGAQVNGYSLAPPTEPNLFSILKLQESMNSIIADIRDYERLFEAVQQVKPEIIFHLAAQPVVSTSYKDPVATYSTNVMGTVHLLECIRQTDCVQSVVNITTDKVYENKELARGYREDDRLCGYDPYSNSKSCSELVTYSYQQSFLEKRQIAVSTARAGNVIGGGDYAKDRIIPDSIRAVMAGQQIMVRNPDSIRPYQHVLDALSAYLLIAQQQYENIAYSDCYNIGPNMSDCVTTAQLVSQFCKAWGDADWAHIELKDDIHEASFLKLDCSRIEQKLGWKPALNIHQAIDQTVFWTKEWMAGNPDSAIEAQIKSFREKIHHNNENEVYF